MPIETLSDTALLTAYARALESERPDALFCDPYARELAGDRGEALASESGVAARLCVALACRTRVFDELLMQPIQYGGVDLVINLAAGLDTRPWRLALPTDLRWIDLDLPDVLHYKRLRMSGTPPRCPYEARPLDLSDQVAVAELLTEFADATRALVISEGILVYLTPEIVGELARRLHEHAGIAFWITDLAGPQAIAMMRRSWGPVLQGARMQFAPAEPATFFGAAGWQETEYRSSQAEARRLGRASQAPILSRMLLTLASARLREQIRRLSGVAVFERV